MKLRERFAKNLRQMCENEPSFAHVARSIGINRQQFNDYITGKSLPNDTIIGNLAKYFNVDIGYFFSNHGAVSADFYQQNLTTLFEDKTYADIEAGNYFCYFLVQMEDGSGQQKLFRSLIVVERENSFTTFQRLTRVSGYQAASKSVLRSKHVGVVLEVEGEIVFLGLSMVAPKEPSILAGNFVFSDEIVIQGTAFNRVKSYKSIPFAITKAPENTAMRKLVGMLGPIAPEDQPDLEKVVKILSPW